MKKARTLDGLVGNGTNVADSFNTTNTKEDEIVLRSYFVPIVH